MNHIIFFYVPIVSKSLLIVLGTLPVPARNDREKRTVSGIPMHSRNGQAALLTVPVLQSSPARRDARFWPRSNSAGVRTRPHTRLSVSDGLFTACFFPPPEILSCAVLPLSRLMAHTSCLHRLCVTGASWICLPSW
jgi:hypothetical protein